MIFFCFCVPIEASIGKLVGLELGNKVFGEVEGPWLGVFVGRSVGVEVDGALDGISVNGASDGISVDGASDGISVDGSSDGISLGNCDGNLDGVFVEILVS